MIIKAIITTSKVFVLILFFQLCFHLSLKASIPQDETTPDKDIEIILTLPAFCTQDEEIVMSVFLP